MTELSGILCIDKPEGFTSFDVVAKMRGISRTRKIGHAGTLDPMATGVLPLFFGRAAKAVDMLPRQDKCYRAAFRLGLTTDTEDITGTVLSETAVTADAAQVAAAAAALAGDGLQVPPMYSAVKVNGKRLYDLARQGLVVERQARPITVHAISVVAADEAAHTYQIDVHCSKGTYIRTLIADIGAALGCGAVMTALRRTMAAGYALEDCMNLEEAQRLMGEGTLAGTLLPVETAFASLPKARLSPVQTRMFLNGVRLDPTRINCADLGGSVAVYSDGDVFLGTAAVMDADFTMTKLFTLEV